MKILLVAANLKMGGSIVSLINLIHELKKYNTEITLLTLKKDGEFLKTLDGINIIEADKSMHVFGVSQGDSKQFGKIFHLKRTLTAIIVKTFGNKWILKQCLKKQKHITDKYDVAIAYTPSVFKTMGCGCPEFVLSKVNAEKKLVFIHNDFSKVNLNNKYSLNILSQFDKIVLVSKNCADGMKKLVPELASKIDYMYCLCDSNSVIQKSKLFDAKYDKSKINIVTVARLHEEKGIKRVLPILKSFVENGINNFCWHIIGDGLERDNIKQYIDSNSLQNVVKLYGTQVNPYPYIKDADLFLLPSYHESFGIVLIESFILGVTVLSTKTISSKEVVQNYGFVCDNNDESISINLKQLLENPSLIKEKQKLLRNYKYDNTLIIKKFFEITSK
ncbi:MAG: glycosyltransferase [Clostridia bacterium]|nr:glycosyltransferase [Clostridia bacterium]